MVLFQKEFRKQCEPDTGASRIVSSKPLVRSDFPRMESLLGGPIG